MIRGIGLVLRFLVILFAIRLVVRWWARTFAPRPAPRPAPGGPKPVEELVRDRICNTFVPRARALAAVVDGREEHFCSTACRDRALVSVSRAS